MNRQVNLYDAKTNLSRLVDEPQTVKSSSPKTGSPWPGWAP